MGCCPPSWAFLTSVASSLASSQVYIAAFAVSAYSSTYHRAGCKPFNPVLGETYECERPDRGFRFISEQVWVPSRCGHGADVGLEVGGLFPMLGFWDQKVG